MHDDLATEFDIKSRLCENETVEVWNIDSKSLSNVMLEASAILKVYEDEHGYEPYSNLVTQQVDTGDGLDYNGVLYVHLF
jgi:hypothetical protein